MPGKRENAGKTGKCRENWKKPGNRENAGKPGKCHSKPEKKLGKRKCKPNPKTENAGENPGKSRRKPGNAGKQRRHAGKWPQPSAEVEAAGRHRAFFVDLPGMGRTPPPPDLRYADAGKTLDIYCNFLKEIIIELNLHDVVLIGHSFGGFISQHFAHRHPNLLRTLVYHQLLCLVRPLLTSNVLGVVLPCRNTPLVGSCWDILGIYVYENYPL